MGEIVFRADGEDKVAVGEDRTVRIFKRGLGAQFYKPVFGPTEIIKVHPDSYAAALGMQAGWVVKSVDGKNVMTKTYHQTMKAITSSLKGLLGPLVNGWMRNF